MSGSGREQWPQVPGYELVAVLGRGGFATVYRARQLSINREVALKVLQISDLDETTERRFRREAETVGALSWHPHVVGVHDAGITPGGSPFLSMELVPAGSFGDRVRTTGALPTPVVARIGAEVADALSEAHQGGIYHRDVKPDNILIGRRDEALLTDFGIATLTDTTRSATGTLTGTIAYTPPELLRGERASTASDVYSLGATLYTLTTGTPAFLKDTDESPMAIMWRIGSEDPPPLPPTTPPLLATVIEGALAKDPTSRPDLDDIEDSLRALTALPNRPRRPATNSPSPSLLLPPAPPEAQPPASPSPAAPAGEADLPTVHAGTPDLQRPTPPYEAVAATPAADDAGRAGNDRDARPSERSVRSPEPPRPTSGHNPGPSAKEADGRTARPQLDDPLQIPPDRSRRNRRARFAVAAAGVLIAVIAITVVVTVTANDRDAPGDASNNIDDPAPTATGSGDTTEGSTADDQIAETATIDVGTLPFDVAATDTATWVAKGEEGTVSRIDPTTNTVTATIDVGGTPISIAATDTATWVAESEGTVSRIDPTTNTVTATIDVGGNTFDVAATDTATWVTMENGTVSRIDPTTNTVTATIDVGGRPVSIAATDTTAWVARNDDGTVSRIDPTTNTVTATIDVGGRPISISATDTATWVTNNLDTVSRIDPTTNTVTTTIGVGGNTFDVAATDTATWTTSGDDNIVTRIDPTTDTVTSTVSVGGGPFHVAATDTAIWVTSSDENAVNRIDT